MKITKNECLSFPVLEYDETRHGSSRISNVFSPGYDTLLWVMSARTVFEGPSFPILDTSKFKEIVGNLDMLGDFPSDFTFLEAYHIDECS